MSIVRHPNTKTTATPTPTPQSIVPCRDRFLVRQVLFYCINFVSFVKSISGYKNVKKHFKPTSKPIAMHPSQTMVPPPPSPPPPPPPPPLVVGRREKSHRILRLPPLLFCHHRMRYQRSHRLFRSSRLSRLALWRNQRQVKIRMRGWSSGDYDRMRKNVSDCNANGRI